MSPKRLVRTARYLVVLVLFLDLELSRRREAADLRVTSPGVLGTRRRAVTRLYSSALESAMIGGRMDAREIKGRAHSSVAFHC